MFDFQYQSYGKARIGCLSTPHGSLQTPAFIFCATKAAMKSITPQQLLAEETSIILSNTYHLSLQPGAEVVGQQGGLHRFMGWPGPMLTDSGGFQIFSLGHGSVAEEIKGRRSLQRPNLLLKISEEGATFRSYLDGAQIHLTPELSIDIQRHLGADLIVVLDECTPFHVDKSYTQRSMEMSHRLALRSLRRYLQYDDGKQALYGIIQGGVYPDLREASCDFVNQSAFFGHAIGGSLGASKAQMYDVVAHCMEKLDKQRPTHLLGIGGLQDIVQGVALGIDTFDCVHPTRLARHGGALVKPRQNPNPYREHINIHNSTYRRDERPLESDCPCYTCRTFSRAYLHHLFKAGEMLGPTLVTIHNVRFMNRFMGAIRQSLRENRFEEETNEWVQTKLEVKDVVL